MSDVAERASGWTDTDVSVRLSRGAGGVVRVDGNLCSAPVWFRWDGATLWMVGSGASPVGEDHIRVRVEVGADVDVAMRSVAATMVYAARGPGTRWDTEIVVGEGARLDWRPEPQILTERARHVTTTTVRAASTAQVTVEEVLVLGRVAEAAGALRSTLSVRVDERPVLLTSFDTSLPGWSGPGGTDGAEVVAQCLRLGVDARTSQPADRSVFVPECDGIPQRTQNPVGALLAPATGCALAVATAADVASARRTIGSLT